MSQLRVCCDEGWCGPVCERLCCPHGGGGDAAGLGECGGASRGRCLATGACACEPGWQGAGCGEATPCPPKPGECPANGVYDHTTCELHCKPGWCGTTGCCTAMCPPGTRVAAWAECPPWWRHGWPPRAHEAASERLGAALRTREKRPSNSDSTERPRPFSQRRRTMPGSPRSTGPR